MSSYNNIDEAVAYARTTVASMASSLKWTDSQKATALAGVENAYKEASSVTNVASSFYDSISFSSVVENALTFGSYIGDLTNAELAKDFWEKLAIISKSWSTFPSYSKVQAWVDSALKAAGSQLEYAVLQNDTQGNLDAAKETAQDYGKIAEKAGEVASNPNVWYGVAAAAVLGTIIYIKALLP